MTTERARRVAEAIKEELSDIIHNMVKDPRIGFASIVTVDVSRDLRHAVVFVSVLGDDTEKRETVKGLDSAKGFMRTELARRLRLRYSPELVFRLDDSIEHGVHISKLLDQLHNEDDGGEQ